MPGAYYWAVSFGVNKKVPEKVVDLWGPCFFCAIVNPRLVAVKCDDRAFPLFCGGARRMRLGSAVSYHRLPANQITIKSEAGHVDISVFGALQL